MSDSRSTAGNTIAAEAADWYARLRAPDVSQHEAMRFRAWIAGDPARRREFEAIGNFWDELTAIENSPEVLQIRADLAIRRRRKRKGSPGVWLSVAATVIIAMVGLWTARQWSADRYVTNVGELRTVPLADGSLITLNTDTEVRLHYSRMTRAVELVRGQANFEVAKDKARPFIVTAGGRDVRAVGTVFDVYKSADKVTVTLIEGAIAVLPREPHGREQLPGGGATEEGRASVKTDAIYLHAGEQLTYATKAGSVRRAAADVPRVTAWRAYKLDFSDTPIQEAIAEANRYSREQIVLEAPEVQDARISGTFEAGKNDLFAEGLQTFFTLDAVRTADNKIILRSPRR